MQMTIFGNVARHRRADRRPRRRWRVGRRRGHHGGHRTGNSGSSAGTSTSNPSTTRPFVGLQLRVRDDSTKCPDMGGGSGALVVRVGSSAVRLRRSRRPGSGSVLDGVMR